MPTRAHSLLLSVLCAACGGTAETRTETLSPVHSEPIERAAPSGAGAIAGFGSHPPLVLAFHAPPTASAFDASEIVAGDSGTLPGSGSRLDRGTAATAGTLAMAPAPYAAQSDFASTGLEFWGGAAHVSFYDFLDSSFRLANSREEWDEADRFEIAFYSREPLHGHVEALIGGFVFYEERDWEEGTSEILFDTWGIGVDMGAVIYPFEGADDRFLNIGFAPFARFSLGWNDGDFFDVPKNVSGGVGTATGELDNLRFDIGVGAELRAVVARRFFFGIGAGYIWWTTADGATGFTADNGGTIIIFDDSYDFRGNETWIRATAGIYF